jgi:hypothetical protein
MAKGQSMFTIVIYFTTLSIFILVNSVEAIRVLVR